MNPSTPARLLAAAALLVAACGSNSPAPGGGSDAGDAGSDGGSDAGAMACGTCFLHGQWAVDNLSPCFDTTPAPDGGPLSGIASTMLVGNQVQCAADPTMLPSAPWSTDKLTIDCPGHYRLCYALKGGSVQSPQASDCTVVQACSEGDAVASGTPQTFPQLPAWLVRSGPALDCAVQFYESGGYGEMSVHGTAASCGAVDKVFSRIGYCPFSCNNNPSGAGCATCAGSDGGSF